MIRHYVLTMTGSTQRLSTVLQAGAGGPDDLPCRTISLQPGTANAAAAYVGSNESGTVSSSSYGVRLEPAAAGVPPAPFIFGELAQGSMKLSDFQVIGANNEKLFVMVQTL